MAIRPPAGNASSAKEAEISEGRGISLAGDAEQRYIGIRPVWRNWQTRTTQNRVPKRIVGSTPTTGTTIVAPDAAIIHCCD
jgi:septal ring-binding cell division protein DamX